jgi:CHAD domain-containing protein
MAYRFKLDEPVEKAVRRIARSQIDQALDELGAAEILAKGVHESRKSLKRLRALLRLVAPSMGANKAKARNAALRDIGLLLESRREADVCLETLAKLEQSVEAEDLGLLAPLRDSLILKEMAGSAPLDPEIAAQARACLIEEARRFSKIRIKGKAFETMSGGLEDSYRAGRRAFAKSTRTPTSETVHDLRKTVQWHWRQMSLLSRAWPDEFQARIASARELSQILGDDHDLAMLEQAALSLGLSSGQMAELSRICHTRQTALRGVAHPLCGRLFAETPGAFRRRMAAYWDFGRRAKPAKDIDSRLPKTGESAQSGPSSDGPTRISKASAPRLASKTPGPSRSQRRV